MQYPPRLPAFLLAISLFAFCCSRSDSQTTAPLPPSEERRQSLSSGVRDPASAGEVTIPGPLRSFLRMAGVSQKASQEEVLPLLARNVYIQGYSGGQRTEFLVLLTRYVDQARELAALAGPNGIIHISNCEQSLPLLNILGYRPRPNCGESNASLITADAERAFLTIDSGFPLLELEESLQHGKEFSYPFPDSRVPVLFTESAWTKANRSPKKETHDLVGTLLRDPSVARLYWAMSRSDAETRGYLQQTFGLRRLLPVAGVMDFYGSHICIRSGRVLVPGGIGAESAWKDLVGASPESPAEFVPKLLAKDRGWLAAYFDALSRIDQTQQQHFVEAHRLKAFYEAFRQTDTSADASRPVFRPAPGLLLLLTRLQWDADGQPLVPGSLEVWKEILNQKTGFKVVRGFGKRAAHWTRPDQLVEAMFAFSRIDSDRSPLQMYLSFGELNSKRPPEHRLTSDTVRLLARRYDQFSDQYLIFSEFPELTDVSITDFVHTADAVDKISNHTLRGNAMGTFQASIGLWQITARQGQIPSAKLNESWQEMIKPFANLTSSTQLFDAGRNALEQISRAATGKARVSQDEIIELLAGPRQPDAEGRRIHEEIAKEIRLVMDGQRLVSLDTLMALGEGLNEVAKGRQVGSSLLPLAGELREFEMPRPIFTGSERTEWAAGIYNNRHTELQMQTDLTKLLKSHASRAQIEDARGQLSPFLRDTLVGLNYAYYEPPGAQILHHNPLFVRSHDFSGDTVLGMEGLWRAPQVFGAGSPAGGGAHLVGSLADLAYVLAEAEQDFIAPENVQALIWRESVPGLITNAVLPRWWGVTRNELHAITLYQRAGEELITGAASSEELRGQVMTILAARMVPQRSLWLEQALRDGHAEVVLPEMMPADTFYLTSEFRQRFPEENKVWGPSGQELSRLCQQYPTEVSWERLSRDFGVPHRILAQSYARELLNLKPFPAFSGYSSRLLAESWDSNNLYWARLADEEGYSPAALNRLVPELTRLMVAKIFATDFEDWPALLRAMREAGGEFRRGKIALLPATKTATQ